MMDGKPVQGDVLLMVNDLQAVLCSQGIFLAAA